MGFPTMTRSQAPGGSQLNETAGSVELPQTGGQFDWRQRSNNGRDSESLFLAVSRKWRDLASIIFRT
jgi:hypothetical protein